MNDKEYTYDIDKYTIGVDENGEDGIGMTVAKIENGGIKFLGNCYGENARCIDLLIKENQKLKKQVDELNRFKFSCKKDETQIPATIYSKKTVEDLIKKNQELKKQLEETDRKLFLTKNELDMREKTIDNKLNQQKEFIRHNRGRWNK